MCYSFVLKWDAGVCVGLDGDTGVRIREGEELDVLEIEAYDYEKGEEIYLNVDNWSKVVGYSGVGYFIWWGDCK